MKRKKLLKIFLAATICGALTALAGCFGPIENADSSSSSSSSSEREPWYDQNVDPDGWT